MDTWIANICQWNLVESYAYSLAVVVGLLILGVLGLPIHGIQLQITLILFVIPLEKGGRGGRVEQRVGEHRLKAGMGPMGLLKSDFNSNE
jgi:hypothetical protein